MKLWLLQTKNRGSYHNLVPCRNAPVLDQYFTNVTGSAEVGHEDTHRFTKVQFSSSSLIFTVYLSDVVIIYMS